MKGPEQKDVDMLANVWKQAEVVKMDTGRPVRRLLQYSKQNITQNMMEAWTWLVAAEVVKKSRIPI